MLADGMELSAEPGRRRITSSQVRLIRLPESIFFSLGYVMPNGLRQARMIGVYGIAASPDPKKTKTVRPHRGRLHHAIDLYMAKFFTVLIANLLK